MTWAMEVGVNLVNGVNLKAWRSQLVLQRSQGVDQWVVGWLVESGWLTTWKLGVKDLKIAPKKRKWWKSWRQFFEILKVRGEVTSRF